MKYLLFATAAAALSWAPAAAARTADYARSDAEFAADAAALDVSDFPSMPGRGEADVVIEGAAALDQRLRILAISCRAWKVDNPLSQMVERALTAWDRDGKLGATEHRPLVRVRFTSALSTMRCVAVGEMETRCLTRTGISGEATIERAGSQPVVQPVSVEVEHEQSIGVCGGLSRGTALSGRSAAIALVERLQALSSAK